jgi:hypothetical protein
LIPEALWLFFSAIKTWDARSLSFTVPTCYQLGGLPTSSVSSGVCVLSSV